jgi:hypothetical protein
LSYGAATCRMIEQAMIDEGTYSLTRNLNYVHKRVSIGRSEAATVLNPAALDFRTCSPEAIALRLDQFIFADILSLR